MPHANGIQEVLKTIYQNDTLIEAENFDSVKQEPSSHHPYFRVYRNDGLLPGSTITAQSSGPAVVKQSILKILAPYLPQVSSEKTAIMIRDIFDTSHKLNSITEEDALSSWVLKRQSSQTDKNKITGYIPYKDRTYDHFKHSPVKIDLLKKTKIILKELCNGQWKFKKKRRQKS